MKTLNRLLIPTILPKEGSFEDLILIEDIKKKVSISQKEVKILELKTDESGGLTWKQEKDIDKKIDFSEAEKEVIKKNLKAISEKKKLTADLLDLYRTFV